MRTFLTTLALTGVLVTIAGAANEVDPSHATPAGLEPVGRAPAVVPTTIAFQGYLTDTGGSPIDGDVNLELAMYPVATGGSALWTELQTTVPTNQGVFAIALGSVTPFPPDLFDGPVYLGIRVDGAAEMEPRTELQSTPYALHADDASNLGGVAPDGYVSVEGDDVTGPLALLGGVAALETGGATEVVSSTEFITVRKYYFDDQASAWEHDARLVLSFNGVGDLPIGGAGAVQVKVDDVLHTVINVPSGGGRPWTYVVELGPSSGFTNADVLVRALSTDPPILIRDISLDLGGPTTSTGNTLDQAYDAGGAGAGRTINATAGPVEIVGPDGLDVEAYVNVGDPGRTTGMLDLFGDFSSNPIVELTHRNGGGAAYIQDENEVRMHYYESDGSAGGGGWWGVYGNPSFTGYVNIDGNVSGTGNPLMTIRGSGSTTRFDTREAGNDAVQLPASAVSAGEILDEPGLSQGIEQGNVSIPGSDMSDVVVTTITTPGPGYIFVAANVQFRMTGVTTSDYIGYQIDEDAGGAQDTDHYHYTGWSSAAEDGTHYLPAHAQRTYYKASAGTYSFRLEARDAQGTSSKYAWNPVITAIYVPTSYGAVSTRVGAAEVSAFTDVETGFTGDNGPGTPSGTAHRVDLRELELRVAREEAQLQAARNALLEAEARAAGNGPR